MMNFCRLFWDNLSIMNGFHNYGHWRCWFYHFFNFCDVFWYFHFNWIRNLNFFNDFVWNRNFNSNRYFDSFFFNYLIRNWNFYSHILSFMNDFWRRRRWLNIHGLLLYLNMFLLDLWLHNNLMLLNWNLLYSLNRLHGSNWLHGSHWLHSCLNHRLCLNRILVLTIICRSPNISHRLIIFSSVIDRCCGYSRWLRPWIFNSHSWIFVQSRSNRHPIIVLKPERGTWRRWIWNSKPSPSRIECRSKPKYQNQYWCFLHFIY